MVEKLPEVEPAAAKAPAEVEQTAKVRERSSSGSRSRSNSPAEKMAVDKPIEAPQVKAEM